MKLSPEWIALLSLALSTGTVSAEDSAQDIYNACSEVFDAMISTAKETFAKKNIDDDKIMTSLLCPLTRTMSESIGQGVENTLDGTEDQAFVSSQKNAYNKGRAFEKIVYEDNKFVCTSMNSLLKNLDHMKRDIPQTDVKATYDILGDGIISVSDACIKQKSVKDVVCPVVEDLVSAVKTLSGIVDESANSQKLVGEVSDKAQELIGAVKCDANDDLKKAVSDCRDKSGMNASTKETTETATNSPVAQSSKSTDCSTTAAASPTSECLTTTTPKQSYVNPGTYGSGGVTEQRSIDGQTGPPKQGTGAGRAGGGWIPTQTYPPNTASTAAASGSMTDYWDGTAAPAPTVSESCDCKREGSNSENVVTKTDADGNVYTTVPFYAQNGSGAIRQAPVAALFAAIVMPLL